MAWRPYGNLINGELDNRNPGKVTGWIRFFRQGMEPLKVILDLSGDTHEDIRGKVIRLLNWTPSDRSKEFGLDSTYMKGFSVEQRGTAGDITAGRSLGPWTPEIAERLMAQNETFWDENGIQDTEREKRRRNFANTYQEHIDAGDLFYPYVAYPYIEWYSEANGRVVLELDPSQVDVIDDGVAPIKAKTPAELADDRKQRAQAFSTFMTKMTDELSKENRDKGGDGNVIGAVIS
jgi:hypothetical protein